MSMGGTFVLLCFVIGSKTGFLLINAVPTRALLLQAQIWQLDFAVHPQVLREINMEMRINEDVLRWVVKKLETPRQAEHPS